MIRASKVLFVFFVAIGGVCTPVVAQQQKAQQKKQAPQDPAVTTAPFKPGDRVVLTSTTKLRIPDKTVGQVRKGVIVTVKAVNGPWIWVRSGSDGWLNSKYVVPLDQAARHFTAQLKKNSKDGSTYEARAHVYRRLGQHNSAIKDYTAALKLQSKNAFALKNRAYTYFLMDNHKAAIEDYTRALRIDPKDVTSWKDRGHNYYLIGNYKKALSNYDAALKLNPKHSLSLNFRAWLLATCPDQKIRNGKEAMQSARLACELSKPVDYDFVDTLAAAYAAAGYYDLAVDTVRQAIKLAPKKERAVLQQRLKRYQGKKIYTEARPLSAQRKS